MVDYVMPAETGRLGYRLQGKVETPPPPIEEPEQPNEPPAEPDEDEE
jgi:hypothetical protein